MKPHHWSKPICVYETIYGVACKNCKAKIYVFDGDIQESVKRAELPEDCDKATITVIHEDYKDWDGETWEEKDEILQWD